MEEHKPQMSSPRLDGYRRDGSKPLAARPRREERVGNSMSNRRWQCALGIRRHRVRLRTCPLKFDLLGHRRDGIADFAGNGSQFAGGNAEPPGPDTDLSRIGQVNLIANGRMFDAMHDGIPSLRTNGVEALRSLPACDRLVRPTTC
jgi:hypothetical protein